MKAVISFAKVLRFAAFALLVPVASALAAQGTNASSVSKVLQEVKVHAGQANYDAEVLDSFARSGMSWESHARSLKEIRGHVNDLLEDYSLLQTMTDKATPQQREAINRLEPLLREMANSLNQTIRSLKENQSQVNLPSFRARIHSDYITINGVYDELCKCTAKSSS